MKFCQGEEGAGNDNEKEMFNITEIVNNRNKKKNPDYKKGTMSFLFKPGNDSKKKKETEKITEEFLLDSYLLGD